MQKKTSKQPTTWITQIIVGLSMDVVGKLLGGSIGAIIGTISLIFGLYGIYGFSIFTSSKIMPSVNAKIKKVLLFIIGLILYSMMLSLSSSIFGSY